MADNNFKAFDDFMAEAQVAAVEVKGFEWKDEKFTLPQDLPAKVGLQLLRRMNASNTLEQQINNIEWLLTSILGKDDYERLLDTNISSPQLTRLMEWILKQYGMVAVDTTDESSPKVAKGKK